MYLIDQNGIAQIKDVSRLNYRRLRCRLAQPAGPKRVQHMIANPIPDTFCPGGWQWTEGGWSLIRLPEGYLDTRMAQVDAERDRRITQGKPHRFPDGTTGTVQLRHERDTGNINAVATSGTALVIAGDTQARVAFRDAEDVTHGNDAGSEAVAFDAPGGDGLGIGALRRRLGAQGCDSHLGGRRRSGCLRALRDHAQGWPAEAS